MGVFLKAIAPPMRFVSARTMEMCVAVASYKYSLRLLRTDCICCENMQALFVLCKWIVRSVSAVVHSAGYVSRARAITRVRCRG
jgi:hypothetical protein